MSGAARNTETAPQGGDITLDIEFRSAGVLTDPDATPTVSIKDPTGTEVETGTSTRDSVGQYHYTYSIATDATISTLWQIDWTAEIRGVAVPDASEYFIVVAAGTAGFGGTVIIDDLYFHRIKKVLAYPNADSGILTDEEIKEICITAALEEYFAKFPIKTFIAYDVADGSEVNVDFPDSYTFGATDIRFVGKAGSSGGGTNSFWEIYKYQISTGNSLGGSYGTPYSFGSNQFFQREQAKQSLNTVSNTGTYRRRVDLANRQIQLFANVSCVANITWAKYSYDFSDVKFEQINNVIKLSQAYLLEHFAQTTQIVQDSNATKTVDAATIMSNAETLRSEVMDKWQQYPDMVLIRN